MNPGPLISTLLLVERNKADCRRRRVACVLVNEGWIVGKGHNALPDGSCIEGECPRGLLTYEQAPKDVGYENPAHPCNAVHAEDAALAEAGERAVGAFAYITDWPCPRCASRLKDAGVIGFMKVSLECPCLCSLCGGPKRNATWDWCDDCAQPAFPI